MDKRSIWNVWEVRNYDVIKVKWKKNNKQKERVMKYNAIEKASIVRLEWEGYNFVQKEFIVPFLRTIVVEHNNGNEIAKH